MKFKESQNLSAIDILKLLQEMTQRNLKTMQENNALLEYLSDAKSISVDNVINMKGKHADNNQLFRQNQEYLDLHNRLLSFLKSLDQNISDKVDEILSEKNELLDSFQNDKDDSENIFNMTVNGHLHLNSEHPLINNIPFFHKLIQYYSENEDYEKCIELSKILNKQ